MLRRTLGHLLAADTTAYYIDSKDDYGGSLTTASVPEVIEITFLTFSNLLNWNPPDPVDRIETFSC